MPFAFQNVYEKEFDSAIAYFDCGGSPVGTVDPVEKIVFKLFLRDQVRGFAAMIDELYSGAGVAELGAFAHAGQLEALDRLCLIILHGASPYGMCLKFRQGTLPGSAGEVSHYLEIELAELSENRANPTFAFALRKRSHQFHSLLQVVSFKIEKGLRPVSSVVHRTNLFLLFRNGLENMLEFLEVFHVVAPNALSVAVTPLSGPNRIESGLRYAQGFGQAQHAIGSFVGRAFLCGCPTTEHRKIGNESQRKTIALKR